MVDNLIHKGDTVELPFRGYPNKCRISVLSYEPPSFLHFRYIIGAKTDQMYNLGKKSPLTFSSL